jgi:hypothetical protein
MLLAASRHIVNNLQASVIFKLILSLPKLMILPSKKLGAFSYCYISRLAESFYTLNLTEKQDVMRSW